LIQAGFLPLLNFRCRWGNAKIVVSQVLFRKNTNLHQPIEAGLLVDASRPFVFKSNMELFEKLVLNSFFIVFGRLNNSNSCVEEDIKSQQVPVLGFLLWFAIATLYIVDC
jgi:hypothetical protein